MFQIYSPVSIVSSDPYSLPRFCGSMPIVPTHRHTNAASGRRQNVDSRVRCSHGSPVRVLHGLRVADSVDRIISIISLSLCRSEPVTSSTTPSQYASSGVSW
jgi:hypothetical protein